MSKFSVVSADSHVVEPAGLWPENIEPAFRDRAPKVVRDATGEDVFFCDGVRLLSPAGIVSNQDKWDALRPERSAVG